MKFLLQIALIIAIGFAAQSFLPWYTLPLIAFLISLIVYDRYSFLSFLAGFLGGGLLWGVVAFFRNLANEELLAGRIGNLFGALSPPEMILITASIGALLAGLGALSGNLLRKIFTPEQKAESAPA